LILLVACANLAHLMLARAAARGQEMSVRAAIGASRGALAGQVLTESLLLSLVGALFGLILFYWGSRVLVAFMTEGSVSLDLRPDLRVLSLALFVGVLTGILFGLAPTWHSSRQDPAVILQPGSRSLAGEAGTLGKVLIITQVALSLVLLLGAGLLVRTFQDLRSLDLGSNKDNLLEIIPHGKPGGHQNLDMNSYQSQLIERISNMPGVRSVGLADISIPNPQPWRETASPMSEDPHTGSRIMANGVRIWPGFFKTLGTRLIAGRDFEVADDERQPTSRHRQQEFRGATFRQRRCSRKACSLRLHAGPPESSNRGRSRRRPAVRPPRSCPARHLLFLPSRIATVPRGRPLCASQWKS
jgi:FtsX-like permease family